MDDSASMCDEIIEETVPTNLNENKANCKTQNFYILLALLLITIALLIAVSIYCYLIKYQAKQKMSNKVKEIDIKYQTYCFFDDVINIKNFNPNNIKIDEKP